MDLIKILDASEKAIATLMLEVNRLNNEIKLKDEQLEALKKELALQKLSDIGQEIENEPVAWMTENGTIFDELPPISGGLIPLYTHPNEDRDSAIYATGYWNGIEYKKQHDELKTLVKSFFEDYLNYQEESDSGRVFNPIHVSCTRVMMIEPLAKLLIRMRELSGVKE